MSLQILTNVTNITYLILACSWNQFSFFIIRGEPLQLSIPLVVLYPNKILTLLHLFVLFALEKGYRTTQLVCEDMAVSLQEGICATDMLL